MKRFLTGLLTIVALLFLSLNGMVVSAQNNDEATLKELVREWANAVVHGDLNKLDKIQDDSFKGNAQGIGFNKKALRVALQSQQMVIAAWTIDDVKVKITGNTAVVSGRSTLTNAKYKGQDFSGEWEWTDRFVKQKDGTWRAVNSQSKRIKQ
jgi:ketosteroid isomerase-like protein